MMKRELKQRERLWREATGHCIYCGHPVSLEEMETDHIVPRARGGGNGIENKVCSCPRCNALKGDASLEEFLRNNMNQSQLQKYLNRLETLESQGKMGPDKCWELCSPAWNAASRPEGEIYFIGGIVCIEQ